MFNYINKTFIAVEFILFLFVGNNINFKTTIPQVSFVWTTQKWSNPRLGKITTVIRIMIKPRG